MKSPPLLLTNNYQETMYRVSANMVVKAATPNWLLKLDLTSKLRETRIAYELLEVRTSRFWRHVMVIEVQTDIMISESEIHD